LATRYDKYERSKGNVSSKIGAKWTVLPQLALRASYAESFKAPTLKQLFANAGQGAINLTEDQCRALGFPAGCAGLSAFRLTGSNPDLKPEQGKSYNVGFIAEQGPFSVSVDAWQIDKDDNITTPTLLSAIQQGFTRFDTSTARWFIFQNLQNFAQSRTAGVDLDSRVRFRGTPIGDVTVRAAGTYYSKQQTRTTTADPWAEFNGTYLTARWRNLVSASTEMGPWAASASYRTTSGFWDTIQSVQGFSNLVPGGLRKVGAYSELDLGMNWRGIKNLDLSFQVKNVLDAEPPFSATNATNNNYSQQGFAELYSSRGRFFQVGMTYRFQ
jgi:iron complex outermembrane recepter protein